MFSSQNLIIFTRTQARILAHWCSSVALEAIAVNELVKTVMRMVLIHM